MRYLLALVLGLSFTLAPFPAERPAHAQTCEFVLGFKTLHDLIPNVVGNCVQNEQHSPVNGDGLQRTTNGLLVWRKASNTMAFTNGSTSWVFGPFGLQVRPNDQRFPWEPDADLPQAVALINGQGFSVFNTGTYNDRAPLSVLLGVRTHSADGYAQRAFFFHDDQFLGTDTSDDSAGISVVSEDGDTITLSYTLYNPGDPMFDPEAGRALVRYQWNGQRVVPLDPIPPSAFDAPGSRR